jgi:hypothetical protein
MLRFLFGALRARWIASSQELLAMTAGPRGARTPPTSA